MIKISHNKYFPLNLEITPYTLHSKQENLVELEMKLK